ncbi:Transcription factor [Tieghemiomyces parasiticus]|uniref:Transcription factor n=1 Tax=Tieghemiomyces parasiticus TaxID=78921 RepID=A0A9W8DUP6_9FUNG|nr:Transcription factor [Tieghemiomyces parasiticus]
MAAEPSTHSTASSGKLEYEPNPFEQSFSVPTTSSRSLDGPRPGTPGGAKTTLLPPISHLDSPSIPGSQFWGESSLRQGPLSPSMLLGPQNSSVSALQSRAHEFGGGFLPAQPSPMTAALLNAAAAGHIVATPGGSLRAVMPPANGRPPAPLPPVPAAPASPTTMPNNLYLLSAAEQTVTRPPPPHPSSTLASYPPPPPATAPPPATTYAYPSSALPPAAPRPPKQSGTEPGADQRSQTAAPPGPGDDMDSDEKRRNFLERNRIAALKCRQRKKQWLNNLQSTLDLYSAENDKTEKQVQVLREEILNLKALLVAHKECPVAQANGVVGLDNYSPLTASARPTPFGPPLDYSALAAGSAPPPPSSSAGMI